jgi:Ca-activated chloride channel family protein
LLELAERPAALGTSIDLGPTVTRVFPRDVGALVADESVVVVGRVQAGALPTALVVTGPDGKKRSPLTVSAIDDNGDLARRWATARLAQMLDDGTGRAAMVDLGSRHGIITPYTSLYVPTKNEMTPDEVAALEREKARAQTMLRGGGEPRRHAHDRDLDEEESETTSSLAASAPAAANDKEGGTGARAKGEEGSMGSNHRYGVRGPSDGNARRDALNDAAEFGMIGMLGAKDDAPAAQVAELQAKTADAAAMLEKSKQAVATAAPIEPAAPAPAREPNAPKPASPTGNMWGGEIGDSFGAGGLGLDGIGEGGGGRDQPGLGSIGTIGHGSGAGQGFGSGAGRLGGRHASPAPTASAPASPVMRAPPASAPAVDAPMKKAETERDEKKPSSGAPAKTVSIEANAKNAVVVVLASGNVPHVAFGCGGAAVVPLGERVQLWRERLARVAGSAYAIANVYRTALDACEAPTFRERARLLSLALDAMPSVIGKVALWRAMQSDLGAADVLYRGLLARVRTIAEVKELHAALGLRAIDPGVLAKLLKEASSPADRAKKLRALVAVWPDDLALATRLLDALEDAGDDEGARGLARTLRARPDADAQLRTTLGELYLRLAERAKSPEQKADDEAEAHRAFGEIVEFSPDDPVARRRLGDLLRAHGFFAEAARQYETLAKLAPDDPSVTLLRAAAAEGLGKLEEAVQWTEKAGTAGAPDAEQGPARTARAFAATYLAWGRLEAEEKGKKDEAATLTARLVRVLAPDRASAAARKGTRVVLTWSHPELHPTLWTNALSAAMPAPEGDVSLGIAQAYVPDRDGAWVEVRLAPDDVEHAARLGATATLTVVFDETGEGERIVKKTIRFTKSGPAIQRFAVAGREVKP